MPTITKSQALVLLLLGHLGLLELREHVLHGRQALIEHLLDRHLLRVLPRRLAS